MSNIANIVQNGIAPPQYLVDGNGNPITSANPLATNMAQIGGIAAQMAGGDGVTAINVLEVVHAAYNGATVDQWRGNLDNIALLASGAVTTNATTADRTNHNSRGVKLYVNTGSFGAGASTITVTIQGKDPVSSTYFTILQSASLTASTFAVLTVYPGLSASANVTASDVLPRSWRVTWQATGWGTGGSTLGIACAILL